MSEVSMNTLKTTVAALAIVAALGADPVLAQSWTTYDYSTGDFSTTTPNGSGGWTTYDYGTRDFRTTTPNGTGGWTTYDYGTGSFSTTRPNGGGWYGYGRR